MAEPNINPYYDRVNPDLLDMIPVSSQTLLEVGCGTGALGAQFLLRQPQARYYGVEMNEQAAEMARSRLAAVVSCDIEREWNPHGLPAGSVDALIFGDVLEHLKDPWITLSRLARLLSDGGMLVACIPNIGHWSIAAGLLAGRFDYTEEGLLDRTHLRFFTQRSILDLVRRAGLTPVKMRARRVTSMNQEFDRFLDAAAPLARLLGVAHEDLQRNLSTFQYLITAAKGKAPGAVEPPATTSGSAAGSLPSAPA